jgi:hypothetical protein
VDDDDAHHAEVGVQAVQIIKGGIRGRVGSRRGQWKPLSGPEDMSMAITAAWRQFRQRL